MAKVFEKVYDLINKDLVLSNEQLKVVMTKFENEISKGLRKDRHDDSEIKCFVTNITSLPEGNETGKYLALDLGKANFRVLLINLKGEEDYECKHKIYDIPENVMTSTGKHLFNIIASRLAEFVKEQGVQNEILPLGFTFSFLCQQNGLNTGSLIKWINGFNCSFDIDQNVVELLEGAIRRRNDLKVYISAILNDTTGTLMSCAWKHNDCKIGVIIGTGSNACYMEKSCNAEFFENDVENPAENVIINTEFGAFGDKGSLKEFRTEYDIDVDENSINPGSQLFEKMISGMYMGELVRLVLVKLIRHKLLFNGVLTNKFNTRYQFLTKYIHEIESQDNESFKNTKNVLNEMEIVKPTDDDCRIIRYCCEVVSRRAAELVSSALAALVLRIGDPHITIGINGNVYRDHPKFHDIMTETIKKLVPPNILFKIVLSKDGSGNGAALVAAVASKEIYTERELN